MSTISEIADKVACGGDIAANTGKLGCLSLFSTPEHLLALRRGTVIDPSETFNLAYITPLIQKGTIIPIIGASSFEDLSGEDTYSTNASNVKRLNLKGLPEYKFMYEEGHEFYREIAKLEGFKNFDLIVGDDEGNWMLASRANADKADSYTGFSAGHVTPELTKRKQPGGDAESKSLLVQFLDRMQWDRNYVILHRDQLTFSPEDVPQVNGATLGWGIIPVAGTTVTVDVKLSADNSTPVEGLDENNFSVTINGSNDTIVSAVEVVGIPGRYTITYTTATVASDVIIVDLSGTSGESVTNADGVLYRSDALEYTVV